MNNLAKCNLRPCFKKSVKCSKAMFMSQFFFVTVLLRYNSQTQSIQFNGFNIFRLVQLSPQSMLGLFINSNGNSILTSCHPSLYPFLLTLSSSTFVSLWACMLSCFSCVLLFCDPMDWSPSGSSVHGIHRARILEWVAVSVSICLSVYTYSG